MRTKCHTFNVRDVGFRDIHIHIHIYPGLKLITIIVKVYCVSNSGKSTYRDMHNIPGVQAGAGSPQCPLLFVPMSSPGFPSPQKVWVGRVGLGWQGA